MYSYASKHTLSTILVQENSEGFEFSITFMSYPLKNSELKYSQMEKHAFSIVKVVKHFMFYILNSHFKVLVPNSTFNSILTQQEFGTKRGNWIMKIQEYDMKIKPTKLVHGRGLCQLIADNNPNEEVLEFEEVNSNEFPIMLFFSTTNESYSNITHFITYGECLEHLTWKEKRTIKFN